MSLKIESNESPLFFRLGKNYLVLSVAEFTSKALTAVAFAYMARIFGPEIYGQLEFAIAIFFLFTLIVDSGLGSYGAREIAKDPFEFNRLFVTISTARLLLAVIAIILMNLFALHPRIEQPARILIFLYSLTLLGLPWLTQWVFQGGDKMAPIAISSLIRWSIFFTGVVVFISEPEMIWAVPLVEGVAIISAGLFLNTMLVRRFKNMQMKIEIPRLWSVWKMAVPIGASEIVWAFRVYFATLILGLFIGGIQLGWFTAAHRIVIALHAFVWLYFYNLFPSLARASKLPLAHVQKMLKISMGLTTWVAAYLSILAFAFAASIFTLIYDEAFVQGAEVFSLLLWILPITLISGHYRFLLIGFGHQMLEFISSIIGTMVCLTLCILFVPNLGGIGAAWSLIISEVFIWFTAYFLAKGKIGELPFFSEIWRPILGGLVIVAILFIFPIATWLGITAATIAYGIFFVASNPKMAAQIRSLSSRDALT